MLHIAAPHRNSGFMIQVHMQRQYPIHNHIDH